MFYWRSRKYDYMWFGSFPAIVLTKWTKKKKLCYLLGRNPKFSFIPIPVYVLWSKPKNCKWLKSCDMNKKTRIACSILPLKLIQWLRFTLFLRRSNRKVTFDSIFSHSILEFYVISLHIEFIVHGLLWTEI